MDNRISYDDAFEALSGLSIDHVSFHQIQYWTYVKDNQDLQNHINKCKEPKKAYVRFTIGDNYGEVSRSVINFYFEVQTKKLTSIDGKADKDYQYVNKLFKKEPDEPSVAEGGRYLHYDTFKQVMRTEWDWNPKKNFISKFSNFFSKK